MNIVTIVQLVLEVLQVFQQLQADGTLAKLQSAEQALVTEAASSTQFKDVIAKVEALVTQKAG